MAQYPINIYSKPFKLIFTFIIPFALVNYYPLLYILDIKTNLLYTLLPLLTILYIIPSNYIFKLGLRKYSYTGS